MSYKLLVFDWDGTLMDSADRIVECIQASAAKSGAAVPSDRACRDIIGLGLQDAMDKLFPDLDVPDRERITDTYREEFVRLNQSPMPMFEGAMDLLNELESQGYYLAVATGKSRRGLDRIFDEQALHGFFHTSRCADETFGKPHPQMLEEIIDFTGVERHETVMIGDSLYDMQMAHNAGVTGVGVSWGVHSCERLLDNHATHILEQIGDLHHWLNTN